MAVTRLQSIPGIGIDRMADKADSMRNANILRAAVGRVRRYSGVTYDPDTEGIISAGGTGTCASYLPMNRSGAG